MNFKTATFLFLAVFTFSLVACYRDNEEELYPNENNSGACDTTGVTYTTKVKSIVDTYCATTGCHNATTHAAGVYLDTYENVRNNCINGEFFCTVLRQAGCSPMPKNQPPLSACNQNILTRWRDSGYPN